VSYAGSRWNELIDDELRDAVVYRKFNKFNRLSDEEAKFVGHAMWNYVAEVYGSNVIPNILYMARVSKSVDNGFLYVLGVPFENIRQTMIAFRGVEHRIEYVDTIKDVEYYNDSKATNPDAAIVAIAAMKSPIILVAGGMDKKNDFTDWIQSFSNKVKRMIVLGETADNIIETAAKHGFTAVEKVNGIEEAVLAADKSASPGDCVLLSPACASWDMFSSYEERGRIFKEAIYKLRG
jgi:UDP-N-acetylmuramoylalanine-D-glutamate ligase